MIFENTVTNKSFSNQGFTLIELVTVIVILAILATIAIPKFANLTPEAEQSVFDTIKSSFKTSVILVHSKSLLHQNTSGFPDVALENTCIVVDSTSGYPAVDQTGACVAVASIPWQKPHIFNPTTEPSLQQQLANINWSGPFIASAHAAPPPPPPPPILSELPSKLIDFDFTGWVWTKTATTGTLTSPTGLTFSYDHTSGLVN